MLSGDWIPVTLPDQVREAFPYAQVMALGGATEAAIWSNWFPVETVDPAWPSIPYGKPIRNARYHILDTDLQPVPGRRAGRAAHRRPLPGRRLPQPAGTDGRAVHPRPVPGWRSPLQDRRPGPIPAGREYRVPRPDRPPGQGPRIPRRDGRNRSGSGATPGRPRGGDQAVQGRHGQRQSRGLRRSQGSG